MRPGEYKILAALMNEPNGLSYTQLRQQTELSHPVLSEYLNGFADEGTILRNSEKRLYFLAGGYQSVENLRGSKKDIRDLMREIPWKGSRIAQIKDAELRKKVYGDFLKFHMDNISILIIQIIRESLIRMFKENRAKEQLFRKKRQRLKTKDVDGFVRQTVRLWEDELTQYHSCIQKETLNWVIPYIQMVSLAYMANAQYTLAGIDKELPERLSMKGVRSTFWFKQLEAIDRELAKRDPEFARMLKELDALKRKQEDEESERQREAENGS